MVSLGGAGNRVETFVDVYEMRGDSSPWTPSPRRAPDAVFTWEDVWRADGVGVFREFVLN